MNGCLRRHILAVQDSVAERRVRPHRHGKVGKVRHLSPICLGVAMDHKPECASGWHAFEVLDESDATTMERIEEQMRHKLRGNVEQKRLAVRSLAT